MAEKRDKTNCCVPRCSSVGSKNPTLNFHKFPNEQCAGEVGERNRKLEWFRVLKIGKDVSPRMTVCSLHFKETYIVKVNICFILFK